MSDAAIKQQVRREIAEVRKAIAGCHSLGFRYIPGSARCIGKECIIPPN